MRKKGEEEDRKKDNQKRDFLTTTRRKHGKNKSPRARSGASVLCTGLLRPQKVPYSDSSSAIDCKMLAVSASSTACSCITFRPWMMT